jgi:hypothetical protein
MHVRRSLAALAAALLCSLAACAESPDGSCLRQEDCPAGQVCRAGRCVPMGDGADADAAGDDGGGEVPACARASDEVVPTPVDIIIAIDESASMGEERDGVQATLNDSLARILDEAGLDYRVILIRSDFCMGPPLGSATDCTAENPPRYYRVIHGVNSSDMLTILLWSYGGTVRAPNTCTRNPDACRAWRDVLRPESQKVFIAVTDDDPVSFSCASATASCTDTCEGCAGSCSGWCPMFQCPTFADRPAEWTGGRDFPTELYALEPAGMFGTPEAPRWIFHSIVGVTSVLEPDAPVTPLEETCNSGGNTAETSGVEYQKLSRLTGGIRFPSCDTDYSPVFERIAATVVPLACTYRVESTSLGTPDPDHTNVLIDLGDGSGEHVVPQDTRFACESGAQGWQWNADYTQIRLCGTSCAEVQESPAARVTITVGCATEVL